MKKRHKLYFKINLISLVFIFVSFISVTLAWFAYSGIVKVDTEIGIKAWHIELDKNGTKVSKDVVISLSEIYPGMDIVHEKLSIKNLGDSDAQVNYSIVSARLLDSNNYVIDDGVESEYVEDLLAHDFPFHININLSQNYILPEEQESTFEVSISWPLDSDTDELDSTWGMGAYQFQEDELDKKQQDSSYQVRPSIQIVISLVADQYLNISSSSDMQYNLGDMILFDVIDNQRCSSISSTCLATYVIDKNNQKGDEFVTLLPNPKNDYTNGIYDDYQTFFSNYVNDWVVETRPLKVEDVLKIISTDIIESSLVRPELSNSVIGNLKYGTRVNTELNKAVNYHGYYNFINDKFEYFSTANCYWTENNYDNDYGFAVKKKDEVHSIIYGEDKTASCNVIPVILANKNNL